VQTTRDITGFPELMSVMVMLAGTWHGSGHVILFRATVEWLGMCKKELSLSREVKQVESSEQEQEPTPSPGQHQALLDATCCLLSYISDVLAALKRVGAADSRLIDFSVMNDADAHTGDVADSDGVDELVQDEDDSAAEDSVCYQFCQFLFLDQFSETRPKEHSFLKLLHLPVPNVLEQLCLTGCHQQSLSQSLLQLCVEIYPTMAGQVFFLFTGPCSWNNLHSELHSTF